VPCGPGARCVSPTGAARRGAGLPPEHKGLPIMDTSDIRKNVKLMVDGAPYTVVDFQFVKPGKGQAFTRVKIRNMATGAVLERTYKSGEKLEPADVEERTMTYIYPEGDKYVFMDPQSGEQVYINADKVGEESRFMLDGLEVNVVLWNGQPIGVTLPSHVVIQITHSEPGIKGDTASNVTKPATLSTGAVVQVPLFVNEGEWVKVDTRTGDYLERVNKR
jgi:elongation factor P